MRSAYYPAGACCDAHRLQAPWEFCEGRVWMHLDNWLPWPDPAAFPLGRASVHLEVVGAS